MTTTILVTGATGNVGSILVDLLQARDVHLRTLPRRPRPMDRATLATVTDGVDAVFLACGNVPEQVDFECAVIDQAAQAGVRRIVKLSARGADPAASPAYWRWHAQIEQHLRASGIPAVVLQPSFLMSNLFAATEHVREQGMLFAPAADARISMIHPGDVAAVAAVALTTDGHDGSDVRADRTGGHHLHPGGRRPLDRPRPPRRLRGDPAGGRPRRAAGRRAPGVRGRAAAGGVRRPPRRRAGRDHRRGRSG